MGRISMPQGKGSQIHNRREYEKIGKVLPSNIDPSLIFQNITLVDLDIKKAYQEIFGSYVSDYNAKQKRNDRKIKSYYNHISNSKNGEKLFYEDVIQWGSKEDFIDKNIREKAKESLLEYANSFEERNPNLKLIGSYIHMDEASPHLHIDYIPVATGYSRGMACRNSLDKAMKEMGFEPKKESRKNNATKLWKESERKVFAEICCSKGLEVEKERKARGSLSVDEYKDARDKMMSNIELEFRETMEKVKDLNEIVSNSSIQALKEKEVVQLSIPPKKSILGRVEESEKQGIFIEGMTKKQFNDMKIRIKADENIENILSSARGEAENIKNTAKSESSLIIKEAELDAKFLKIKSSAEYCKVVFNAETVIKNKESIISKAKEKAEEYKSLYDEVIIKIKELLSKKGNLENEVERLENKVKDLNDIEDRIEKLYKDKEVLEDDINYRCAIRKLESVNGLSFFQKQYQRDNGRLVVLYKDGKIRNVGSSENGGFDERTKQDIEKGICEFMVMETEENVLVPKKLYKELIGTQKVAFVPPSSELKLFIENEEKVVEVEKKFTRSR